MSHWSSFIFESALNNVLFILINPKNLFSYKFWRLDHYPLIVSNNEELQKIINGVNNKEINIKKILSDFVLKSLEIAIFHLVMAYLKLYFIKIVI